MSEQYKAIYEGVMEGDQAAVVEGVNTALAAGGNAEEILNEGMISAMTEVGRLFEEGEYFVPEMLIAARAMKAGLSIIKPLLVDSGIEPVGKVAIGTVKGDLHDIGKNLVDIILSNNGFKIFNLGIKMPAEQIIEKAKEVKADIIGLSGLLVKSALEPIRDQL